MSATGLVAYINGHIVPEDQARVSIWDAGVRSGEWVFESTRTFNHKPFRLRDHLVRLYASMKYIDIDCGMTIDEMESVTLGLLDRNYKAIAEDEDFMFTHDVSRGMAKTLPFGLLDAYDHTVVMTFLPMAPFMANYVDGMQNGLHAVIPAQRTIPARLLDPKMKNRNRIHFSRGAREAAKVDPKAWAVFLDEDGFITEGGGANFLIVKDDAIISPEGRNILRGISRQTVKDFAPRLGLKFIERNVEPYDVHTADEAFFSSTPYFVMPCVKLDGRPIGDGKPGPVVGRLLGEFSEGVGVDIVAQARRLAAGYLKDHPSE